MIRKCIESVIFWSRWVLVPFYLGLIVAQSIYCVTFCEALVKLCRTFRHIDETEMMVIILTLVDITMIANLIKMIISGSYQSFVNKIDNDHSEKVSSGLLKVKMGSSLIGVSSIHLLQSFINTSATNNRDLFCKCSIHLVFLVSTMGLAWIDHLHVQNHSIIDSNKPEKKEVKTKEEQEETHSH